MGLLNKKIKSKYYDDCRILKEAVGGTKNIDSINRCSTRIRIVLNDISKLKKERLETTVIFKQHIVRENTLQLIIKGDIESITIDFLNTLKISYDSVPNDFDISITRNDNFFKKLTDSISIIMKPIIPLIITLAIVATISNILNGIKFGQSTIAELNKGLKMIANIFLVLQGGLNLAFSVLVPWSIFKLMKGSQAIGISIGVVLCFSQLATINSLMDSEIFKWPYSFWGEASDASKSYPWKISLESQILPLVGASFFAVYLERWFTRKKIPVFNEMIAIPGITIVTFFVTIFLIAPFGVLVTFGINTGVLWATTDSIAKYFFNPLFGLILPLCVVTGFVQIFVVVNMQQFTMLGGTTIMPIFTQVNIAVGASVLAFSILNKKNKEVKAISIPAYSLAFISGTSEPCLFGIGLRFLFPMIASSIGTAIGVFITTFAGIGCAFGTPSILIFLSITQEQTILDNLNISTIAGGPYLWMAIAIVVNFSSTFLLTIFLSKIEYFKKISENILDRDFATSETDLKQLKIL